MKYTKQLLIILALLGGKTLTADSQQLRFGAATGVAVGETDFLKKSMLVGNVYFGYERSVGNDFAIITAIGMSSVSFSYYDQMHNSVYNERFFFCLPISARKYIITSTNKRVRIYYGIGVDASWCIKNKLTIKDFQSSHNLNGNTGGFNGSLLAEAGVKLPLTSQSSLTLGLQPQVDLLTKYSNASDRIRFFKNLFCFALSLDLKKLRNQ